MSDVRQEIVRLRGDMDRLRERVPRTREKEEKLPGVGEVLAGRVRAAKAKGGEAVALGAARVAVYSDALGGVAESDHTSIWSGRMKELPSDAKLQASASVLAHTPFQMRAMHRLLSPLYEGRPMQLTKRELAAEMGVDEATLERELASLVAKKTLHHFKTAEGEEAYALKRWDLFLLQLSLAG
jgi:hypothetical protein